MSKIRQMQMVFHAHRSAATQSIHEAAAAKKAYEKKLLESGDA